VWYKILTIPVYYILHHNHNKPNKRIMELLRYIWPRSRPEYETLQSRSDEHNETYKYKGFSSFTGVVFIVASAVALGLGNSLDPLSTMAMIHPFFLISGFEISIAKLGLGWAIVAVLVTHSAGFAFGFSGLAATQVPWPLSFELCYLAAIIVWSGVVVFSLVPHYLFTRRFPKSVIGMFVFAITITTLVHCIIGPFFSSFISIANAVLDYGPLRQSAAVFGIAFIHFVVNLLGTMLAFVYLDLYSIDIKRISLFVTVFVGLVFLYGNFELVANRFYQANIISPGGLEYVSTVQASCIYGQQAFNLSVQWNELWNSTNKRLASGDAFILWSEESASIFSLGQEAELLNQARAAVAHHGYRSFLGVTYLMTILESPGIVTVTNNFALIAPDSSIAWIYEKAFPVPVVEANVQPGSRVLPVYNSSKYGILSGAICFDIEFPDYIKGLYIFKCTIRNYNFLFVIKLVNF